MRPSLLLGSTSFRLSAIYAALLILSFLFAAGGAWLATRSAAMDEAGHRLEHAYREIDEELDDGDVEQTLRSINRRARLGALLWRFDGADGALLGGDETLPNAEIGLHMIDLPDAAGVDFPDTPDEPRGDHAVLTRELTSGGRLTLALDIQPSEIARDAALSALIGAGTISVLVALAAGVWATRRALSRMDALSGAARNFGAGDLAARAPLRPAPIPDDFDELGAAFNQMFDRVDRLIVGVRRVSADVAHELRTPLTHVRQKLEAARTATSPAAARDAIEGAQTDIDALLRTFEAMLRLSEIESGALRARFTEVDLAVVAESVCDAYRPDIEAAGRVLVATIEPDCRMRGDASLLAQAIANLIENASRHTSPGTRIAFSVALVGGRPTLSIRDDGPGVPAGERERILAPFERLDRSRSTPGSGLGLSIVDAVAHLHGAKLELQDANPGLHVLVSFPQNS